MSYSHNQRKKTIKKFKIKYGKSWHPKFIEYTEELIKQKEEM